MTDFEARRMAMVESQLRPNEVTDKGVLAAMRTLPRERFVPEARQAFAYMDDAIEVLSARDGAPARALLAPMVQARLIQLAEVQPHETVLDVGCATGYSTAILASLGRSVVGLEPEPELVKAAKANLASCGLSNAEIVASDLTGGYGAGGPYDVIVVEGSVAEVPESLLSQLKAGGRLVAVRTREPNMRQGKAYLFVQVNGEVRGTAEFDAAAWPLPEFAPAPSFAF